jgi:hypothetical protein
MRGWYKAKLFPFKTVFNLYFVGIIFFTQASSHFKNQHKILSLLILYLNTVQPKRIFRTGGGGVNCYVVDPGPFFQRDFQTKYNHPPNELVFISTHRLYIGGHL